MHCGETLHKLGTDTHIWSSKDGPLIFALLDNRANSNRITAKTLPSSTFSCMAEAVARAKKKPVVCVFCGASKGNSPPHTEAARSLAGALHEAGVNLVYGGGTVGLIGEIARTLVALAGPDSVHGITLEVSVKFENHDPFSPSGHCNTESIYGRTTIVEDMHTRKSRMFEEVMEGGPGGGFVALSGGFGTLEELIEITTWKQLNLHHFPVVVYNVENYWKSLKEWIQSAVSMSFVEEESADIIRVVDDAQGVMRVLASHEDLVWVMSKL